jgi:hypothetical protein
MADTSERTSSPPRLTWLQGAVGGLALCAIAIPLAFALDALFMRQTGVPRRGSPGAAYAFLFAGYWGLRTARRWTRDESLAVAAANTLLRPLGVLAAVVLCQLYWYR